jgi:hypothetical protein
MQVLGGTHWASEVQVLAQVIPAHMNGAQSTWVGAWQVPWPSQVPGVLATLPAHDGGEQVVSASYTAHEPNPSHTPVGPQAERPCAMAHFVSAMPRPSGRHCPSKPV